MSDLTTKVTELIERQTADYIYETIANYIENLYDSQSINTVKEAAQAIRELSPSST